MAQQVTVRVELGPYVLRGREVEAAEVQQAVGEHARLELAFLRDPRAVASPVAALRVGELAGAGVRVVFVAEGGSECLAFEGHVRDAEIDHLSTGAGRVTVLAVSESYALAEHVDREYLREQTLPALAGRLGVRLDGAVPAGAPRDYVRPGVSAWAFLAEAAAQEGLQLRARWPRTPGGAADQPAELGCGFANETHQLTWGRELAGLSTGLAPVNAGVTGAFYDPAEKHDHRFRGVRASADYLGGAAPVVAAAGGVLARDADGGDPGYAEPGRTTGVRARTLTEFRERLALESARRAGAAVRARGASVAPSLRAGDRVEILDASAFSADGVGGELDDRTGVFGLMAVTHRWTGSLYENAFTATPWAGYHPTPGAAALDGTSRDPVVAADSPAGGAGYALAVVTDNASSDGMAGVRVRYAWMSEGEQSDWIRVAGLGGGNTRGVGVLPSVGDEVVVVAVAGDPEHPVVVGALWNGVDKAWHEPGRQVWVTPAGNSLVFLEDKPGAAQGTAETAELYTPAAKAWMQLAQKGPTGVPTITLHSEGDLSLEAPNGELRLSAKRYVAHVSGEYSTMVGKDLATKAQGAVTVESGARLAMKAGADVALRAGGALHAHASDSATIVGSQVAMNPPGATASSVTASVPALARSAWGPRPVPKPGPGRSTEDPKTPTRKELAARVRTSPSVATERPSTSAADPHSASAASPDVPSAFAGGGPLARPLAPEQHKFQDIAALLSKSATGMAAMQFLNQHTVPVNFERDVGSYWNGKNIVVDDALSTDQAALTLVHEVNHAQATSNGTSGNALTQPKADYVSTMLTEEAAGTVASIEAKHELISAGVKVTAVFPLEKEYGAAFARAYQAERAVNSQASREHLEQVGRAAGVQRVLQGFEQGEVTASTTGETYPALYNAYWSAVNASRVHSGS